MTTGGLREYWELARPFTLVAPALGIASGAVTAFGASDAPPVTMRLLVLVAIATVAAALLNAASNTLNQVADLAIDRINKPSRPLPSGRIGRGAALGAAVAGYALSVGGSFVVAPACGALFAAGALLSVLYSVGLRTKRHWLAANLTIALARGLFLKVAGWASVRPPDTLEPWLIGAVFASYTFGAINSKDFADVEGDRAAGIRTLVIAQGPRRAARFSAWFFVAPFLAIPVLAHAGWLTGNPWALTLLGVGLGAWGARAAWSMLADPEGLARENHPSWGAMYRIMFALQLGFAAAYLF